MRTAEFDRKTTETDIAMSLNLDGTGKHNIETGIGFFDHMLQLLAVHGALDLQLKCVGDLRVDGHHSVEDIGICIGKCLSAAFGDKNGICRYGFCALPMDESLAEVAVDVSGRPYLVFNAALRGEVGGFDYALIEEFFRALCVSAGLTLHINLRYGTNLHHMAEAIFKGFGRALRQAKAVVGGGVPSSKGLLE